VGFSLARHGALFAAVWIVVLLRSPRNTLWPSLINEDGAIMFKHYYENPGLENLWLPYAGYVSVMPDLVAFLGANLPPTWVGYAYMLVATASFAIACTAFHLPRFRRLLPSDDQRLFACLLLGLVPVGDAAIMRAVTYSFWPWLFVSILVCVVPGSRSRGVVCGEAILLALNACSSPVSILLVPAIAWRAGRGRTRLETTLFALVALVSIAYLVFVVDLGGGQGSLGYAIVHAIPAFGDRVGFEPVFSDRLRMELIWRGLHAIPIVVGWATLVAIGAWIATDPARRSAFVRERAVTAWMLYFIAALTGLALASRFGPAGLDYASAFHQRYFWIQQCLIFLAVATAAAHDPWLPRLLARPAWRRLAIAGGLSWLIAINALEAERLTAATLDGRAVADFLARIEACEAAGGCAEPVTLVREEDAINAFEIGRFRDRAGRSTAPAPAR